MKENSMIKEKDLLKSSRECLRQLAKGINPVTGQPVGEDDCLRDVMVSRSLFYAVDLMEQVIETGKLERRKGKAPFAAKAVALESFPYSDTPLTVSEITNRINDLVDADTMRKCSLYWISDFLLKEGYLQTVEEEPGKKEKRPTDLGLSIGIRVEERRGQAGPYCLVLYEECAQHFIVDNLEAIVETALQRRSAAKSEPTEEFGEDV